MATSKQKKVERVSWGKDYDNLPPLEFLRVQKASYNKFLEEGINKELQKTSPIEDFTNKNWELSFIDHYFDKPEYSAQEALQKGLTFNKPLKVLTRLINKRTGEEVEEEVFFGDFPQMTAVGTFVINGVERAIVNQLIRSPGVFYSGEVDQVTGRTLYIADLRPLRGSWMKITVDRENVIEVRIDRHRKFPISMLLRAAGLETDKEIKKAFAEVDQNEEHQYIQATLAEDETKTREEALIGVYKKLRPGEPAILDNARTYFNNLFFNSSRYDLGKVGRYKINKRLGLDIENTLENQVLCLKDLKETVCYLIKLQNGKGKVDDIDHLANRRIRRVGELVLDTAFRVGLYRLERSIKEKMSLAKTSRLVTPGSLINPRPMVAVVNNFFRRDRLSAILDQTNPLAELTNLRRLSPLGKGGVTRERASFSMRDINPSQYSRIDPIRSPEGPNIGLVTYLATYARVNEYGFVEAPYKKVEKVKENGKTKMKVTEEIVYMAADEEEEFHITHAEVEVDQDGYLQEDWVPVRYQGDYKEVSVEEVEYIDVLSRQVVGVSASLIPFLSHDEANRALMGSRMQCQAVPLLKPEAPVVGTGMEDKVATAMERSIEADYSGEISWVDADRVILEVDKNERQRLKKEKDSFPENIQVSKDNKRIIYNLDKFKETSSSTSYSQRPMVEKGEQVEKGDLLVDGPACDHGELALGQNLLVAYCSFEGLEYEDAMVISDRVVTEDLLTSVYINNYEAEVMDTKLGPEELTRDIPHVGEKDLANLTEGGIVAIGSEVGPNDILVGKIAPKGEKELTAEERLLRAIFGEKARDVKDTSLRVPHGERGTVIDIQILSKEKGDELEPGVNKLVKAKVAQIRKVVVGDKVAGRHGNKGVISKIVPQEDMPYLEDGTPVDLIISPLAVLARMNLGQLLEAHLGWAAQKQGYNVAIPVFESPSEEKIREELKAAGLPEDGKVELYNGKTGEKFEEKVAVGLRYILKLVHMVEDKKHARSTGPYSLVTQQPLGGKAQMGGQRLGEMEVWALEAHRAAHTLKEMLTIKSDDIIGRSKAFEAIVKGMEISGATVPESFKVLVKELNSLGINVLPKGKRKIYQESPEEGDEE